MRKDRLCQVAMSVCLFSTGCFSYGPAPYYQPGTYGTVPHTAMGPNRGVPMAGPPGAVWVPATPQPGPVAGTTIPQPARPRAPISADKFEDAATNKLVPEPADPGNRPSTKEETDSFGFDDGAELDRREPRIGRRTRAARPDDLQLSAAEETSRSANDGVPEVTAGLQSAEFTTRVLPDAVRRDERFGYDTENYSWLQGIVEQGRNGTWHLVYSPTPDDADQFGGEVTLKRTAALNGIRHRAVIRVEGHFDSKERDRLGKPVYEVDPDRIDLLKR